MGVTGTVICQEVGSEIQIREVWDNLEKRQNQ